MGRRGEHSLAEIKAMALNTAIEIITQQGLAQLSARKVAKQMGYTVGTLYLVFKNFHDLVSQANAMTLDELYRHSLNYSQHAIENKVLQISLGYLQYALDNPNRWRAIFEYQMPEQEQWIPEYAEKVQKLFALVESLLVVQCPSLPSDSVHLTAHALWSGVHGICVLALTGKLQGIELEQVPDLVSLLVNNCLLGLQQQD